MVSTSTLPPRCTVAPSAAAAATDVLPTPPEPQNTTISLAASSCSSVRRRVGRSAARAHSPSSAPSASATMRVTRRPCARTNRYGTYSSGRSTACRRCSRCVAPRAAQRDREPGRVEHLGRAPADRARRAARAAAGARSASNVSSSAWVNSSGSTRFTITRAERHVDLAAGCGRPARSSPSTGISSGVVTTLTAVSAGSASSSDTHCGLAAQRSDVDQLAGSRRPRRAGRRCDRSRPRRPPRGRSRRGPRSTRAPPSTILPIVRISFTPGAAVATKSSTRASGPMPPDHRHPQVEPAGTRCSDASVSIAIASTPGMDLRGREADRRVLELRGDVALGVDLDEQDALADARPRAARWPRPSCSCRRRPCP